MTGMLSFAAGLSAPSFMSTSPILGLTWVNPAMLGFLSMASIPLIIYLINRQRFQRVPWAAMEFLLAAMRKNRRRLQLENLLLLLVRILLVLLFVFGMARPLFESGVPVLDATTRSELFVVDRSYSMGFRDGSRSVLFQAREELKSLVKSMSSRDRVGLILAGGFPEVELTDAQFMTPQKIEEVIERLESIEFVYEPLEVAVTLQTVAQWIETQRQRGAEGRWQVHFYTDLQRADWLNLPADNEFPTAQSSISEALANLADQEANLILHPLGPSKPRNVTVEGLSCTSSLLTVDLPTAFQVRVTNHSKEDMAGLEVELYVNGEVQGSSQIALAPGATREPSFPYVFREAGSARVTARMRSDGLEGDNIFHSVFEVRESVDVLIADGTMGNTLDETEGSWLRAALAMPTSSGNLRLTPYEARTLPAKDLAIAPLDDVDILVLTNVPTISALESDLISEFLEDGGGVLVFLGSLVNPTSYAENAYKGGEGWFPYAPEAAIYDESRQVFYKWQIMQKEHPALRYLAREPRAGMEMVPVHGFVPTQTALPEGSVLMELSDARRSPALVEKFVGTGTVLVLHVGADRNFSELPVSPAYLVFLHETLPYLTARGEVRRNLQIREPFTATIPAERFSSKVSLISSEGSYPVNLKPIPGESGAFRLDVAAQDRPGMYEVGFGGSTAESDKTPSEWFAVNADPREGNLTRVPTEELKDFYPDSELYFIDEKREAGTLEAPLPSGSGEFWRTLFWGVLALLALESVLACFFGRGK